LDARGRSVQFSSEDISGLSAEHLIEAADQADDVVLTFDSPVRAECLKIALLVATLSRRERIVRVEFGRNGANENLLQSLRQTLLGPLIWRNERPGPVRVLSTTLGRSDMRFADRASHVLCLSSGALDSHTREAFQADLALWLREAGILISDGIFGRVAAIAFEANSNAEEHGAVRIDDPTRPVSRFLAAVIHRRLPSELSPTIATYTRQYYASGHSADTGWLEILVVDAGMGMAYPSHYQFALETGRISTNVYEADPAEEQQRLGRVLEDYVTTKGAWGRVLNNQTTAGEGTKLIKVRLGTLRGYASVRTGRCIAHWYNSDLHFGAAERAQLSPYTVEREALHLFHGTAWQILVPLNPQFTLSF
jgi:hypothetical protein